jgi:hypothetical protein
VKRKFKILGQVAEYSMDTQVDLVLALSGLYNFIRQHEDIDHELANIELEVEEEAVQEMPIDIKSAGNTYIVENRSRTKSCDARN